MQEANAIAVLDIPSATFTAILPLGFKDHSVAGNEISVNDQDNVFAPKTFDNLFGMYQPDGIAAVDFGGTTYLITANEGDARDYNGFSEEARVSSLTLDPTAFPNATVNAELGRLTVTTTLGDTDSDGDYDQLYAFGGRSFTVWTTDGTLVFDSGNQLDQIIATNFTANYDENRDDNKGVEPESLTIGQVDGETYLFVGLERANGVAAFRIDAPDDFEFAGFLTRPGDTAPEVITFIPAADAPGGEPLLVAPNEGSATTTAYALEGNFTLQLLHFSDGEAGLLASTTAPLLAALVDGFDGTYKNTLILAGGDNYIPGPFFAAGTDPSVSATHTRGDNPGAADIEIHNRIGVEASTVGNHEFDFGTRTFSDAVADAAFPYLTANLDFSGDADIRGRYTETVGVGGLENVATLAGRIVPSAVVEKGGELIGLVGATTQILESIASTGGVEVEGFAGDGAERNDMALLAAQLQPVIDDLIAQGVNKIVLMAHLQQIAFEIELAPLLSGVDIILAAGSNTRLGDATDTAVAFPGHAANFADTYPLLATGADGGTTLIVNTDNEYTYLGRLVVEFDPDGNIILDSLDPAINGAYAATAENVAAAWGVDEADLATTAFADGTKGAEVAEITDAVQAVIAAKDGEVWGFTECLSRRRAQRGPQPGDQSRQPHRRCQPEAAEAALGGGILLGALKNGGGIRAAIGSVDVVTGDKEPPLANPDAGKPEGGVSKLDIENSLRFNNRLMVFDTDAAGLKAILEHGVAVLGNQGRFPQIGGIAISYDPDLPAGSRILNIAVIDENGNILSRLVEDGVVFSDATATISVVTLNFLAQGGDSYPIKANGSNFRYLLDDGTIVPALDESLDFTAVAPANALGEQQAAQEFLQAFHATPEAAFDEADTGAAFDTRLQNLNAREDGVFAGVTLLGNGLLEGTGRDDDITARKGADTILAGFGDDTVFGARGDDSIDAGAGDDSVQAATGDDTVLGGAGNDTLLGGTNDDRIEGGIGDDLIDGGTGLDLLFGNEGDDTILGGRREDTIFGGDGNDSIDGEHGFDSLFGGDGDDTISGGLNRDTLEGGAGDDVLSGGSGPDLFIFGPGSGNDIIIDFSPADRILLNGLTVDDRNLVDTDGSGPLDLVLDLSDGGTITLIDVVKLTPVAIIFA